jgi:hypothetical protein
LVAGFGSVVLWLSKYLGGRLMGCFVSVFVAPFAGLAELTAS